MPVKVTAWACKWKCGRKVTTKKKGMKDHEGHCWANPASQCCQTCSHGTLDEEGRYCELGLLPSHYREPPDPFSPEGILEMDRERNLLAWNEAKTLVMMRACDSHAERDGGEDGSPR